jgi:hypothetical protein
MTSPQQDHPLQPKLEEIRSSLMGDPSRDELEAMQLRLDVMEKYDRQTRMMMEAHHHDHMDDHDHSG